MSARPLTPAGKAAAADPQGAPGQELRAVGGWCLGEPRAFQSPECRHPSSPQPQPRPRPVAHLPRTWGWLLLWGVRRGSPTDAQQSCPGFQGRTGALGRRQPGGREGRRRSGSPAGGGRSPGAAHLADAGPGLRRAGATPKSAGPGLPRRPFPSPVPCGRPRSPPTSGPAAPSPFPPRGPHRTLLPPRPGVTAHSPSAWCRGRPGRTRRLEREKGWAGGDARPTGSSALPPPAHACAAASESTGAGRGRAGRGVPWALPGLRRRCGAGQGALSSRSAWAPRPFCPRRVVPASSGRFAPLLFLKFPPHRERSGSPMPVPQPPERNWRSLGVNGGPTLRGPQVCGARGDWR